MPRLLYPLLVLLLSSCDYQTTGSGGGGDGGGGGGGVVMVVVVLGGGGGVGSDRRVSSGDVVVGSCGCGCDVWWRWCSSARGSDGGCNRGLKLEGCYERRI